jgi:2-dehydropantoate 2-reductase
MKICVFGAGAVGGAAAALLAHGGHDVSVIGRGAHFEAMREGGIRMIRPDGEWTARPTCCAHPADAGPQDAVIVSVKAHDLGAAAEAIQPLLGPDTVVISAQNGIPWWYFHGLRGTWDGHRLAAVDSDGRALKLIGLDRAVGCVVTGAFAVTAPGTIRVSALARYALGEPKPGISPRLASLSRALSVPGMEAPASAKLRDDVWFKLLGNVSFSMICVITGANMATLIGDAGSMRLARAMMVEAHRVAEAVGVSIDRAAVDARLTESQRMSSHKPSTLQDLERGRPMEIDAIIGAVCEIGRLTKVPTPTIDMIYALVRMRAQEAGCYPANPGFAPRYDIRSELLPS